VYTELLVRADDKWDIIHNPSHDELKAQLEAFMHKIVKVTRVVPRIEKIFREKRDAVIADIKKIVDDTERTGGNSNAAFERSGIKVDPNYQNLNEEEKQNWWVDRFELPPLVKKYEYVDRISKKAKITDKIKDILRGIDEVENAIEEDKRLWNRSEEKRQIYSYMNSKGRWLNKMLGNSLDEDPTSQYADMLENL